MTGWEARARNAWMCGWWRQRAEIYFNDRNGPEEVRIYMGKADRYLDRYYRRTI